jgi:signal peptidase I
MTKEKGSGKSVSEIAGFIETLIITFFLFMLVFTYLISVTTVSGSSMEDTLLPGDKLIVSKIARDPDPGDIIIVEANDSVTLDSSGKPVYNTGICKTIVKRVIASEGQTIDIDFERGAVYVDGSMLDETYVTKGLTHLDSGAFTGQYPVTIPEGFVFVMGDNRNVSKDSRSAEVGLIPLEDITGKAVLRIYPFSSFGAVD